MKAVAKKKKTATAAGSAPLEGGALDAFLADLEQCAFEVAKAARRLTTSLVAIEAVVDMAPGSVWATSREDIRRMTFASLALGRIVSVGTLTLSCGKPLPEEGRDTLGRVVAVLRPVARQHRHNGAGLPIELYAQSPADVVHSMCHALTDWRAKPIDTLVRDLFTELKLNGHLLGHEPPTDLEARLRGALAEVRRRQDVSAQRKDLQSYLRAALVAYGVPKNRHSTLLKGTV